MKTIIKKFVPYAIFIQRKNNTTNTMHVKGCTPSIRTHILCNKLKIQIKYILFKDHCDRSKDGSTD